MNTLDALVQKKRGRNLNYMRYPVGKLRVILRYRDQLSDIEVDIDDENWEVRNETTDIKGAYGALVDGKMIFVDGTYFKFDGESTVTDPALMFCQKSNGDWSYFGKSIPLEWVTRTDMEIIEPEE